ncbi:MAG TPA: methanogenesis marker 2 protein [Thermoplasmata archaeon]|nr:methanogenesis marker 2 protein [Thermoplasmata archaeon]
MNKKGGSDFSLDQIIEGVRRYQGVTRKNMISAVIEFLPEHRNPNILAGFGEDAAVILDGDGDSTLLLATDGIMEDFLNADPFFAGYCAVLVNVNDIYAMGGTPLAMVETVSIRDFNAYRKVMAGVAMAIKKFDVPMVGGHTHPDSNYAAIDIAILGSVKRGDVILSSTAQPGDEIVFAVDLDGRINRKFPYAWDTTFFKDSKTLRKQTSVMNDLAYKHLLTSGKDISNPGSLGSLGMLLETSNVGAVVDITRIPKPKNVLMNRWVLLYPGIGFVVTCKKNSDEVCRLFRDASISAEVCGRITKGHKYVITDGEEEGLLLDFEKDKITGIKKKEGD